MRKDKSGQIPSNCTHNARIIDSHRIRRCWKFKFTFTTITHKESFVQLTQLNCAAQSTGNFLFHSSVPFLQTAITFHTSTNVSKTNSSIIFFFSLLLILIIFCCYYCCHSKFVTAISIFASDMRYLRTAIDFRISIFSR